MDMIGTENVDIMSETMKKVEEYKYELLDELLSQITKPQREFFVRIFPNGVTSDKMDSVYNLIERTIKKNIENPARLLS